MRFLVCFIFISACMFVEAQHQESVEKSTLYTIPVVFHVVHQNGNENISFVQIEDALRILNENYSASNPSLTSVHNEFQGLQADAQIEFKLAKIAPNGTVFNGVTRTVSSWGDSTGHFDQKVQAIVNGNDVFQGVWPENNYLNIIVCTPSLNEATSSNINGNCGMEHNSVFVLHNYVGSIGTGATYTKEFLTYEVGRWLKLNNTFGEKTFQLDPANCSQDDGLADTPNCIWVASCDLNNFACGERAMTENFMALSYCMKFFTNDQVEKMHETLNDTLSHYYHLWQADNLFLLNIDEANQPIDISLFPNPSSELITIKFDLPYSDLVTIDLIDVLGVKVQTIQHNGKIGSNSMSVHIDPLNDGIYFLKLSTKSSENITTFIKD